MFLKHRHSSPSRLQAPVYALLLLALLALSACVERDDEATLVMEDLAAGEWESRLKQRTPAPLRVPLAYEVQGRHYQGDLYRPQQPPLAGIVLVPGVAERGKDDPRLTAFASTLARARFLVLVPDIANLRALRVRATDARGIADAFAHLISRRGFPVGHRAGIGAFSYAVGPALLAALDPAIRERVDFMLGVGGYYDLDQVVTFFTTGYFRVQGELRYRTPNRYGKWVFIRANADRVDDPQDRATLQLIAKRKSADPEAELDDLQQRLGAQGRAVYTLVTNRDPARVPALIAELPPEVRRDLAALTLTNKDLSRLQAELILVHGRDDSIIPYTESVALAAAVSSRVQLFLVHGLGHMNRWSLWLDRRSLWRAVQALLAQRALP